MHPKLASEARCRRGMELILGGKLSSGDPYSLIQSCRWAAPNDVYLWKFWVRLVIRRRVVDTLRLASSAVGAASVSFIYSTMISTPEFPRISSLPR